MPATATINTLINGVKDIDPTLRDALIGMARELERLGILADPAPTVQTKVGLIITQPPPAVIEFTYILNPTNISLYWTPPTLNSILYEVRQGSNWDTATRLFVTINNNAIINPLLIGTTRLLIKTLTDDGVYSLEATALDITIPEIGALSLTAQTLDSNVLLYWTVPASTFNIAYYIVEKDTLVISSRHASNFFSTKELAGGTFEYCVTAVDIAGNIGPETCITIEVADPADFVLLSEFMSDFTLGTKVNTYLESSGRLLVNVDTTQTYQEHYTDNSWTTPQQQIDAGYPLYIQPVPTTGSYKEVFDIGTIITNSIITTSWVTEVLSGSFTLGASIRVSDDNISWSSPVVGQRVFVTSVRYIEITMNFTGSDDKALMEFYNFQVAVSIKEEIDSGEVDAISTDADGTVVTFNKPYKDVNSITLAVKTTTEGFMPVYRFSDIPNPTEFAVFVYDTSGIRVSKTVSWKTRGIV